MLCSFYVEGNVLLGKRAWLHRHLVWICILIWLGTVMCFIFAIAASASGFLNLYCPFSWVWACKSLLLKQNLCFRSAFRYSPLLFPWSPVGVVVEVWGGRMLCSFMMKSQSIMVLCLWAATFTSASPVVTSPRVSCPFPGSRIPKLFPGRLGTPMDYIVSLRRNRRATRG